MGTEIMRMFKGRGFWLGFMTAMAGISLGASYPKLQGFLNPGSFIGMETEALKSNTMIFFLPLAAVLPWSDSFIRERQGGFLKTALPRTGRCYYVKSKVFTTALGGFLSVFLAGMLVLLVYFMIFFPLESQGKFPWSQTAQLGEILLRCGLVAGILSTGGGIFAGLTGSVYLAFGFPFVLYYFCVIVRDRYFEKALWLYPPQWMEGTAEWGEKSLGLWLFLLVLLGILMALYGGILYDRVEEI